MLALKGASAQEELDADRAAVRRLGVVAEAVETYGAERVIDPATTVVRVTLGARRLAATAACGDKRRPSGRRRRRPR